MALHGMPSTQSLTMTSVSRTPSADATISILRWEIPDDIQTGSQVMVSVYFSRALIPPESLVVSDLRPDGINGATVQSVEVNSNDPTRYDIIVNIPAGAEGVLSLSIDEMG